MKKILMLTLIFCCLLWIATQAVDSPVVKKAPTVYTIKDMPKISKAKPAVISQEQAKPSVPLMLTKPVPKAPAERPAISPKTLPENAPPMQASQVKPPAPPAINPQPIPAGMKPSAREAGKPPQIYPIQNAATLPSAPPADAKASVKDAPPRKSYPVQNPANLPKEIPAGAAPVMVNPPPPADKPLFNGHPNVPDRNISLQGGDNFGNATIIAAIPYSDNGTTAGYYNDYEGNCGGSGAPDVVYRYDATSPMLVTISLCGSSYDTKLYVCLNGDPNAIIGCNDDNCGLQSQLDNLSFSAGNSYFIVVDGYSAYYGDYVLNVTGTVVAPNPCDYGGNPIYSNGAPDGLNGLSSLRTQDGVADRWVIDDMSFGQTMVITDFHWVCVTYPDWPWNQTDDVMILADNAGVPGNVLYDLRDVPNTRIASGRTAWGLPEYIYTITGLNITLPAGTYWIGLRPVGTSGWNNYWETAPRQGNPVYISFPDLGYPMWTPGNVAFGGVDYDVSFCVTGYVWTPPDPCDQGNTIYNNGPADYVNGWQNERTTDGNFNMFIINDAVFGQPVVVHDLHWSQAESGFQWGGTADFIVLQDAGGVPGAVLYETWDVASTRYATGNYPWGLPEYKYSIDNLNISLPAGTYWFGMRPVGASGYSYMETSPLVGNESYIDYSQYGFPRWTPGNIYWGTYFDFTFCITGEMGISNPCGEGDVIYNNGSPDYVNGWFDFRSINEGYEFFIIDDMVFPDPVVIHDFHWWTVENGFEWNGTDDFIIVADAGGVPGATIVEVRDVPNTRVATGNMPFNLPEYIYTIEGLNINLPAGTYWLGVRPVGATLASYWLTAPRQNNPSYIDYSLFGYPRWTPGYYNFGVDQDFAFCVTGETNPIPDPCSGGDVLYFNGYPDFANGLFAYRSLDGVYNEWVVDDVVFNDPVIIHDFHWYTLDFYADWNGTDDILILSDNAGTPGNVLFSMNDVPNTRVPTGRTNFGLPEYIYTITGVSIPLPPGRYWVGLRPVGLTGGGGNYWETAPVQGSPVFVDYPYFGYPAWTPGNQPFGEDYDVSFCITGEIQQFQDPCIGQNVLYYNGAPDMLTGLLADRTADGINDFWVIDDMTFTQGIYIQDFHWYTIDTGIDWNGTDDFIIVGDGGGVPGATLYDVRDVPNTRVATGRSFYGVYPEYCYTITGLNIYLPPGRYWLGLRPVANMISGSYWETTNPIQGSPVYVAYPEYPAWTPSITAFGEDYDVSFCVTGIYGPPPSPCDGDNVLYYNGYPDDLNGLNNCRTLDGALNLWVVDDFTLNEPITIQDLHWYSIDAYFPWNGTDDYVILADAGGVPGDVIAAANDVPNSRYATGRMPFGLPEYVYSITGLNINLPVGRYWIGMRPVGTDGSGMSFWSTTAVRNSPVYVDYSQYGYPPWTPGFVVYGTDYDASFCITGIPWQEPSGSCCDSETGNCADNVPQSQCPSNFRFTPGVLCADLDPPCRLAPGCDYVPGDINGNGVPNGIDVVYGVNYLKGGAVPPTDCNPCCPNTPSPFYASVDVNGSCSVNGIDITYFVNFLKGGAPLRFCDVCPPQEGCPPPEIK